MWIFSYSQEREHCGGYVFTCTCRTVLVRAILYLRTRNCVCPNLLRELHSCIMHDTHIQQGQEFYFTRLNSLIRSESHMNLVVSSVAKKLDESSSLDRKCCKVHCYTQRSPPIHSIDFPEFPSTLASPTALLS